MLIKNARLFTPTSEIERGWLRWENGIILALGAGDAPETTDETAIDANGLILMPGFIDLHVHGAVGYETMDGTVEALQKQAKFYAQNGVTSFLPTTWSESRAKIDAAIEAVKSQIGKQIGGATILGIHLEGPYLNVEKTGAQNPQHVRRADREEAMQWLESGIVRLIALAPEYPENLWLIEECVTRGITVSIAHTDAKYHQIVRAVKLGVTHATHTFNAMSPLNHREPGVVGAVLTMPALRGELIADNIHVHPVAMNVLWKTKGAEGIMLITDAMRGTGLSDGDYSLDGQRTVTIRDSQVRLPDGTLAGSIARLNECLRNFQQATGEPLYHVWQTSSLNAARSIKVDDRKGSLAVGKDADLVLVDEQVNVYLTVAEGIIVHQQLPEQIAQ